jgi:hypothetical protein
MSIRSELETRIKVWADAQSPPIPVAFEGIPFNKPKIGPWLRVWMLANVTINPTVDAARKRTKGIMQVDCCVLDGTGSAAVEALANSVAALFPVLPKTGTVSIEQPPQTGQAFPQDLWRIIPVTISYRQES